MEPVRLVRFGRQRSSGYKGGGRRVYQLLLTVASPKSCCKCNRSSRCRNCSCVKSGRTCQGCLPQRLGKCANGRQPSSQPASSDSNQLPNLNPTQICSPRHLLNSQSPQRPDVTTLQPVPVSWSGRIPPQPYSSLTLRGVRREN